jgi:DnaD/phage-associated family protein
MLDYNDFNLLFGCYDWLRLPSDVIMYMLVYAKQKYKKSHLHYVRKLALDWAKHEIFTVEAAINYTNFNPNYRTLSNALGITPNSPTDNQRQRRQYDKWLKEFDMPMEVILEACYKAAEVGKLSTRYVNGILESWNNSGIRTMEAVEAAEVDYRRNKAEMAARKTPPSSQTRHRNRFANFKAHERDFAKIERLEREHLMKSLGMVAAHG